jgi:hypothetical protein
MPPLSMKRQPNLVEFSAASRPLSEGSLTIVWDLTAIALRQVCQASF